MGRQPAGETLVRWGDVLLKTIRLSTNGEVLAVAERASLGDGRFDPRATATVALRYQNSSERWLLAEGWWADSFPPLTYRELVSWSVRALPWSLSLFIAQRYWRVVAPRWSWRKLLALGAAVGTLLIALALTPFFILMLGLTLVLGVLPISQLRSFILSAQSALTATLGDSLAFVESPLRAALIRTRIVEGLEFLHNRCERTVIVAHSQGAAATLECLGGIVEPLHHATGEGASQPLLMPDALITFGSGTNQIVSLKLLSAGLPTTIGTNPAYLAMAFLFVAAALIGKLYVDLAGHAVGVAELFKATVLWSAVIASTSFVAIAGIRILRGLSRRVDAVERHQARVRKWILAPLLVAIMIGAFIYADSTDLPFGPVTFLFGALGALAGSTKLILSADMEEAVCKPVRKPVGLGRWMDIYASADPVPNGPTRTGPQGGPEYIQVWNRGSFLADHTRYWENLDGFVLRSVRLCAQTARSAWQACLATDSTLIDQRAAWRVGVLRLARWITILAWTVLFLVIWRTSSDRLPLLLPIPNWLPELAASAVRLSLLIGLVGLATWGTCMMIQWPWKAWVRSEQRKVLKKESVEGVPWRAAQLVLIPAWVVVLCAVTLAQDGFSAVEVYRVNPMQLVEVILAAYVWTILTTAALAWLWPPPRSIPTEGAAASAA
jgi:hypothetical protein